MTNQDELKQLRYENEQLRRELNGADEQHYDECVSLRAEIALLKQQLKHKELH